MRLICVLGIMIYAAAARMRGDTIELKTGEHLDGTFRQAGSSGVVIDVGGQAITIPLQKVQAIYFGKAPSGPAPTASGSKDALESLLALKSVTQSGIAFREYSSRVLDARVRVDRYLNSPSNGDQSTREAIKLSMLEYELASRAWATSFVPFEQRTNALVSIGLVLTTKTAIASCPGVMDLSEWAQKAKSDPAMITSLVGQQSESAIKAGMITFMVEQQNDPGMKGALIAFLVSQQPSSLWICANNALPSSGR